MIEEEKWYTITQLTNLAKDGIVPLKSRDSWLTAIKSGKLHAIQKGSNSRFTYVVQGKDINEFLERNKVRQDTE